MSRHPKIDVNLTPNNNIIIIIGLMFKALFNRKNASIVRLS